MEGIIDFSRVSRVSRVVSYNTYTGELSEGYPPNPSNVSNYTANRITFSRVLDGLHPFSTGNEGQNHTYCRAWGVSSKIKVAYHLSFFEPMSTILK